MPRPASPTPAKPKRPPGGKAEAAVSAKGDLSRYRDMRDFSKTPEPSGVA